MKRQITRTLTVASINEPIIYELELLDKRDLWSALDQLLLKEGVIIQRI